MKKVLLFFVLLVICSSPWWLYLFKQSTPLHITIMDVSSSNDKHEARRGIYQALLLDKIVNLDGDTYKVDRDYIGVNVIDSKKKIVNNALPYRIDDTDIIYLSDMQGIKERELSWGDSTSTNTLYGGLTRNDWRAIQRRLKQPKPSTFIVEYNSITDTTEDIVRTELEQQLGIEQTGYQARYYNDLQEAPLKSPISGSGLVIQNKFTGDTLALTSAKPVVFAATEIGKDMMDFEQFEEFHSWFDLAVATDAQSLANYKMNLSDKDSKIVQSLGLPTTFSAISYVKRLESNQYFFAGKFSAQSKKTSKIPPFVGYKTIQKLLAKDDAFYWHQYIPMMDKILNEAINTDPVEVTPVSVEPIVEQSVAYNARVSGDSFEVLQDGVWKGLTIKGVNIGMAKPGLFPGEAGITKEDYTDWLKSIGEMGANTIRVYTIHPPGFYEALLEYNESHETPIYLIHGVWLDEEPVEENLDVYGESTDNFQNEIHKIVDILHGNANIEARPGHASGVYTADVAPYMIGWMLGIEWYPHAVSEVNEKYKGKAQFEGEYFKTKEAEPFEIWLAEQMEYTAKYEAETYQWMHPFSFTNWVTTDLLEHPYEPDEQEDLVSVNPNVIYEQNVLQNVGQFASYHVYPYYPDFLNYTPKYLQYIDSRGKSNNYAAYLHDLHAANRLPVLIAEFGVPASRGLTHKNPFGWNQGFLSERQQGEILVQLYEDILYEDLLGGMVFTWQDEWFKRTWNTSDLDNPDQRPFWSNAQTNEQQFGLLSFDTLKIKVDGDTSDWFGSTPLYETEDMKLFVDSDERYLYLRLDINDVNFSNTNYPIIYFNTLKDQGNSKYEKFPLLTDAEFVMTLKGANNSHLQVDAYYDMFQKIYGDQIKLVEYKGTKEKNSGQFNAIEYALNRELTIPNLNLTLPFEKYEAGLLRQGNGNPNSMNYDSLSDYQINEEAGIVEIRLPWLLFNVTDPGRLEVWSDLYANDELTKEIIQGIEIGALHVQNDKVLASLPQKEQQLKMYSWKEWQLPEYDERLKESYYLLQEIYTRTK